MTQTQIQQLAIKLHKLLVSSKQTFASASRELKATPADIEDALCYLVEAGFLARSFEWSKWTYKSHKANRAKRERPLQDDLFDPPQYQHKTIEMQVPANSSPMQLLNGPDVARFKADGWQIVKWKPRKEREGVAGVWMLVEMRRPIAQTTQSD